MCVLSRSRACLCSYNVESPSPILILALKSMYIPSTFHTTSIITVSLFSNFRDLLL